jgi:arylsulfatase A-like enzyme
VANQKKPNIVMIMADDVGTWNLSAYHRGMMGGSTPNIDRIAREGAACHPSGSTPSTV